MVLRDKLDLGADKAVVGPAERMPPPPFWAFAEAELIYVDGVVGPPGTGPVPGGFQDPDEPDSPDQTWQTISIQRAPFGQAPRWAAKPDNHDKNSCVLAVQIPGIYVHAKLMVIDDVFVSVGSSNLNRRGFMHDGEMNVFAVSEHLNATRPTRRCGCAPSCGPNTSGCRPEMGLSLLADPLSALKFFGRSWYRGTHWQPLATFGDGTQPPVVALSVGSSAVSAAIGVIKDLVLVTDRTDDLGDARWTPRHRWTPTPAPQTKGPTYEHTVRWLPAVRPARGDRARRRRALAGRQIHHARGYNAQRLGAVHLRTQHRGAVHRPARRLRPRRRRRRPVQARPDHRVGDRADR